MGATISSLKATISEMELQKAQDLERGVHDRAALEELQQSLDEMGAEKMSLDDQIAELMKQVEADYNLCFFLIDDMVLNNYMGIFM
jgi:predicted  nucleic acid-binding Zn-ribbon protein